MLLVAAVGTWALWPEREYPFTVSPDTTYFTGPLNPDGTVNYVAALNERFGKGVTPENNAAPLLLRAWGADIIRESTRSRVFEILQMEPVPEEGLAGRRLKEVVEDIWPKGVPKGATTRPVEDDVWQEGERVLKRAMAGPWSADELPAAAAWLKANEERLALVGQAAKRPRYYIPLVSEYDPACMMDVQFAIWSEWIQAGEMYVSRAMNKLHRGDADGACGDLLAAHRLARLVGQGWTVIDKLFALVLEGTVCEGDAALATSGKLTAAQQRDFLAELEALPKVVASPSEGLLFERLCILDLVGVCRRKGPDKAFELLGVSWSPRGGVEWDRELREINAWLNRYEEAQCKPNYADSVAAFRTLELDHCKLYARVRPGWLARLIREIKKKLPMARTRRGARRPRVRGSLGEVLVAMILPAISLRDNHDRCIMRLEIAKLALALGAYRKEKGNFPAALSDLRPEYLKQIPQDTFAGKPLIYKRIGKGYLLYSLGPNMIDDGGVEDEDTDKDDIPVRVK